MGKANTLNGFHLLTFLRATMINFMQSLSLSAISVFVRFCKSLPPELFLHLSSWNESLVFAMLYTLLRVKQYKLLIKYSNAEIKRITSAGSHKAAINNFPPLRLHSRRGASLN